MIRTVLGAAAAAALILAASAAEAAVTYDPDTRLPITYDASGWRAGQGSAIETPAIPRQVVSWSGSQSAGTIVVNTAQRRLYLVLGGGKAMRYAVGVGRPGFEWGGVKRITMKQAWPSWRPPQEMLKRRPDLPRYMPGGEDNPLGARALYLGGSLYRIHGSNEPHSIGHAVSSGCIRMLNGDIVDLYSRVRVGTTVIVQR